HFKLSVRRIVVANGMTNWIVLAEVGLTVGIADQKNDNVSLHPGTGIALADLCGKLLYIMEPSLGNLHHRQYCHTILVLTALGLGLKQMYDWHPEDRVQKCLRGLGLIAGCAYVSHLLCDAVTPRSLPLLGKLG